MQAGEGNRGCVWTEEREGWERGQTGRERLFNNAELSYLSSGYVIRADAGSRSDYIRRWAACTLPC